VDFTSSLGTLIVIFFGGQLVLQGVLPIADLVAFFLYLEMFYTPVRNLSNAWEAIQSSLAGADRVSGLMAEDEEPHNVPGAVTISGHVQGGIVFQNVSFTYTPENPVLENIDLDIPARSVVALVGPTGVGKSTLVSLIPRFYDVTSGRITLDGRDIQEYKMDSLRQQISIVLQDVFLFYGTVRENILFGRPNATEADMIAAAQTANAHEFIEKLPELARAIAEPLGRTDKITIISNGGEGVGASKLTKDVVDIIAQLPPVLEGVSGVNLKDLISKIPGIGKKDVASTR